MASSAVALRLGLSMVVLPLLGLFLNDTPWGIHTGLIALGLCDCLVATLALASYARRRWSAGEAFFLDLREAEVRRGVLIFALVTAVVGGVPSLAVALRPAPRDTEFYVLGSHGRLEDYPRTLAPGETFQLTFGVTNRAPGPQSYTIRFPSKPKASLRTGSHAQAGERMAGPRHPHSARWQRTNGIGLRPLPDRLQRPVSPLEALRRHRAQWRLRRDGRADELGASGRL